MWIYYLCGVCGATVGRIETRCAVGDGIPVQLDDGLAADVVIGRCRRCRPRVARTMPVAAPVPELLAMAG